MDTSTFDSLTANTRLQKKAITMARSVLVDGLSPAAAGRGVGLSRQAASAAAGRVLRELRRSGKFPGSWRVITSFAPPSVVELFELFRSRALYDAGLLVDPPAFHLPNLSTEEIDILKRICDEWEPEE